MLVSSFFPNNFLNAINEDVSSNGYLAIRATSILVSLNSVLLPAIARILGKMLGPIPVCALHELFNYYFSTLQRIVHFAIVFSMLLLMQKYYVCIDNSIALTLTLTLTL